MFKYTIVVEVSPDMSFKSMEELVEAIKLWRGVRNVELDEFSGHANNCVLRAGGYACTCGLAEATRH